MDPVAAALSVVQGTAKLIILIQKLTNAYRASRTEIWELDQQLTSWTSKLNAMAKNMDESLLTDADVDEWHIMFRAIHDSFVKLGQIVGNKGRWTVVKYGLGRSEEVQKITCFVEKNIRILYHAAIDHDSMNHSAHSTWLTFTFTRCFSFLTIVPFASQLVVQIKE
jgi:hypothetical protein